MEDSNRQSATKNKVKTINLETQRDEAATKDKTFAPRRHRDTEKKDKWVPCGPVIHAVFIRGGPSIFRPCVSSRMTRTRKNKGGTRFSGKNHESLLSIRRFSPQRLIPCICFSCVSLRPPAASAVRDFGCG